MNNEALANDELPVEVPDMARRPKGRSRHIGSRYGAVFFLLAMVGVFSLLLPDTFPTVSNFRSIANSYALLLLLSGIATLALRIGEFDLSIAATMVFAAAVATVGSVRLNQPLLVVLGLCLVVGLVVGSINGFLIVRIGVGSLITTLGMLTALGGVTFGVMGNTVIGGVPDSIKVVARTQVLRITTLTLMGWFFIASLWYVYERTPLGRYMLFVGGNPDAARLAGLRVDKIRFLTLVASSSLAALAGFLLAGRLGAMDPSIGPQFLLQPFAAAFLGATMIKIGRFNAVGTLIALYLIAVGVTGLQLLGAEPWVANLFNGAVLVVAVAIARVVERSN